MNNKNRLICFPLGLILLFAGCTDGSHHPQSVSGPATAGVSDRTVLPVPDPVFPKITEMDARNATAPPPFSVNPPEGAPNIVIVLIDDI